MCSKSFSLSSKQDMEISTLFGVCILVISVFCIVRIQNRQRDNISFKEYVLETANLKCQQSFLWIPIFLKVYVIGIMETMYIAIYKRGLISNSTTRTKNEAKISQMIAHYKEKHKNETPTAVITGGDSGIGLEITRSLLQAGFHVVIGLNYTNAYV